MINLLREQNKLTHELTLYQTPTITSKTIDLDVYIPNEEDILSDDPYLDEDIHAWANVLEDSNILSPLDDTCDKLLEELLTEKAEETIASVTTELTRDDLERFLVCYIDKRPQPIIDLEKKMEDSMEHMLFTKAVEYAENIIDGSTENGLYELFGESKTEQPLKRHPMFSKYKDLYIFHAFICLNDYLIETDDFVQNPELPEFVPNPEYISFSTNKSDGYKLLGEITLRFMLDDDM